jgi:rRNA maturation protein Nop10
MFENKKCKNCGEKVKDEWEFCPYCGEETTASRSNPFENVFEDVEDEFKRIDKMFGSDFFKFPDLDTKMTRDDNGINIIITSGTGREPKIQVKTSDNFKNLEPEIKRNLGVRPVEKSVRKVSKVTEEPETEIKTSQNKQVIQIKLPEIKSFKDVEVKKLEQSLEIKAFTKNKTYFKLIPIPSNSEILNKELKNNVLKIEVGR